MIALSRERREQQEIADRQAPSKPVSTPRADMNGVIEEAVRNIRHGVPLPQNRIVKRTYDKLFDAMTIGDSVMVELRWKARLCKAVDGRNKLERERKTNRQFLCRTVPEGYGVWCVTAKDSK